MWSHSPLDNPTDWIVCRKKCAKSAKSVKRLFSWAGLPMMSARLFGLGPVAGGVVFFKLSKLLNQEDALSVPCLRGVFCSPRECCEKASSIAFDVRSPFAVSQSSL